jgi:hypothetical protein
MTDSKRSGTSAYVASSGESTQRDRTVKNEKGAKICRTGFKPALLRGLRDLHGLRHDGRKAAVSYGVEGGNSPSLDTLSSVTACLLLHRNGQSGGA